MIRIKVRWRYLVFLVILIGIVFRAGEYIPNRSFWFDEVVVARRIAEAPLSRFIVSGSPERLAYPVGFLAFQKIAFVLFGSNHEYAMRFFPFLVSLLSLFLFYPLVSKILSRKSALLALLLFSVNAMLSYYATEPKPYSFDVLFSIILCWIFFGINSTSISKRQWLGYGVLVFSSVWFSYSAFFIILGGGLALIAHSLWNKDFHLTKIFGIITFAGALSFLLNYILIIRHFAFNEKLHIYWDFAYPSLTSFRDFIFWIGMIFKSFYYMCLNYPLFWAWVLSVLGGMGLYRKNKRFFFFFIGVLAVVVIASMLHVYPFWGRLALFLVPLWAILLSASLEISIKKSQHAQTATRILLSIILVFAPLRIAAKQLREPYGSEEIKPVLNFLSQRRKPGQAVYIFFNAVKTVQYYALRYPSLNNIFVYGEAQGADPGAYQKDLRKVLPQHRYVWVIYTHIKPEEARALETAIGRSHGFPIDDYRVRAPKDLPLGYLKRQAIGAGARLYYFQERHDS